MQGSEREPVDPDIERAFQERPHLIELKSTIIEWYSYRRDYRYKKWVYSTLIRNLKKAERVGIQSYSQAVEDSMDNQWQGIFPKENTNHGYRPRPGEQAERIQLRTI